MAELPHYPHEGASRPDAVGAEHQEAASDPYPELVRAVMQASFDWSVGKKGSGVGAAVREFIEQRHTDLSDTDNLYHEASDLHRAELDKQDREFTAARVTAQGIVEAAEELATLHRRLAGEPELKRRVRGLYNLLVVTKNAHLDQSQAMLRREELLSGVDLSEANPLKFQLQPLEDDPNID